MVPCQLLVPDGVTRLTTEPELRPYSAPKLLVVTWYSWTKSGFERNSEGPATELSLLFWPSICWSLFRPRMPSTEKPTPLEFEKVLSRVILTPGICRARKSIPSFSCKPAKLVICCVVNVVETWASVVSSRGGASVTSTVTVDAPTANLINPTPWSVPAATSTLFTTYLLKLGFVNSRLYVPICNSETRNNPAPSVVVVATDPVPVLMTRTCTPGTTPPDASIVVPEMEPLDTCARAGAPVRRISAKTIRVPHTPRRAARFEENVFTDSPFSIFL